MSKKIKPRGKKLKNMSDPTLARPHKQGETVYFTLSSVDPKWGRYLYYQHYRYGLIFSQALEYYKETIRLLDQCRQLKVDEKTDFRRIPDNLRDKLEINSIQFLILINLGLEYLGAEYKLAIKQIKDHRGESYTHPLDTDKLGDKLKALKNAIELESEIPIQIYTIIERRGIVEHPTTDRLWGDIDTGWKSVNLSWVLCGEIEGIIEPVVLFVKEFVKKAEVYIKNNPIPGALTGVKRGLKAGEQYKKPTS